LYAVGLVILLHHAGIPSFFIAKRLLFTYQRLLVGLQPSTIWT